MALEVVQQLEEWINTIIVDNPTLFLVTLKIKPTNNITVIIDGDEGFSIDANVRINRQLYKKIEEAGIYPEGDFSLEVSSPGITEPLKLLRQYSKNIGREVEILFKNGELVVGKLLTVAESEIQIETKEGKGKKMIVKEVIVPLEQIKTTTVQIKF
jgi:ribosome maturation factor RimP